MEAEGIEEVPVTVAPDSHLVGLLSRSAIRNALNHAALSMVTVARSDVPIAWSADYRVAQIRVGGAAGRSIRHLDPRARFGVNIVAIKDADNSTAEFGPADPDRILHLGDVLLAAGSPSSVRSFQRELVTRSTV